MWLVSFEQVVAIVSIKSTSRAGRVRRHKGREAGELPGHIKIGLALNEANSHVSGHSIEAFDRSNRGYCVTI